MREHNFVRHPLNFDNVEVPRLEGMTNRGQTFLKLLRPPRRYEILEIAAVMFVDDVRV